MYLMCTVAAPAGSSLATVKVAISFFSSLETLAVCVWPAAVTVTSWKSISTAFSVMVLLGLVEREIDGLVAVEGVVRRNSC